MVRAWGGPLFWVCSVPGGISLLTSPPPFKQYKLFWGTLLTTLKRCPLKAGTSSSHSRKRRDKFLDLFQARFRRKSALSTMRAKPNHFSRVFATATCTWLLESTQWQKTLPQISHFWLSNTLIEVVCCAT